MSTPAIPYGFHEISDSSARSSGELLTADLAPLPPGLHPDSAAHIPDDPSFPAEQLPQSKFARRQVLDPAKFNPNINPWVTNTFRLHMILTPLMRFSANGSPQPCSLMDLRIATGVVMAAAAEMRLVRPRRLGARTTNPVDYSVSGGVLIKLVSWAVRNGWVAWIDKGQLLYGDKLVTADITAGVDWADELGKDADAASIRARLAAEVVVARDKPKRSKRSNKAIASMASLVAITPRGIVTYGLLHNWMRGYWEKADGYVNPKEKENSANAG